ncbi:MAG: cadherin repeat domain-containing protein [Methylacidiphilales bacterium]|nr:cadherin repeat domain-containing protein [Candidatus Methylacidiphilales bacterium]
MKDNIWRRFFRERCGLASCARRASAGFLCTALLLIFFSSSTVCNSQVTADPFAQNALNTIIGDLQQEIANGSTATGSPVIYTPTSNAYMVPVRNGVPATWNLTSATNTTLLRISSTTSAMISGQPVDHPASNALSTNPSANGRILSTALWNLHYLIQLKNINSPTDSTPDMNFIAPSWVYVTSTGPAVITSTSSSVLGRYAYAIYDEGALLDANVAGFPRDTSTTSMPAQYAPKGSIAFADLTALNIAGSRQPKQAGVNSLVGWRNYATLQPLGTFPTLSFSGTGVLDLYKNLILSNTNGFLIPNSAPPYNGQSDQLFPSRQQLINRILAIGTTNFNPNNLQYLGTFSRAVTTPSWSPPADSTALSGYVGGVGTSPVAYKSNADNPGSANRNLLNLRFPSPATITHYNDDGTTTTYSANFGDPFLKRRFSLAKLAWLTYKGPSADLPLNDPLYNKGGTDANIQACFGLQWRTYARRVDANGTTVSDPCWKYVGASGSTPQPSIETLAQVASENREPNFFEMLKVGILNGSLGRDPGALSYAGFQSRPPGPPGPPALGLDQYKVNKDQQIVQIGANIIDQYDADSYPTAIYFPIASPDPTVPEQEPVNMVYGTENLPYLQEIDQISIGVPSMRVGGWLQPVLWNPHQVANPSATGAKPANFKIAASGQVFVQIFGFGGPTLQSPTVDFDNPAHSNNATIYFNDAFAGTSSSSFYIHPQNLNTVIADTVNTPAINVWNSTYVNPTDTTPGNPQDNGSYPSESSDGSTSNKFVGFNCGYIDLNAPTPGYTKPPNWPYQIRTNHSIAPSPMWTACLQYLDSNGVYRPYSYISRIALWTFEDHTIIDTTFPKYSNERVDPRTDRFSILLNNAGWGTGSALISGSPAIPGVYGMNQTANYRSGNNFPTYCLGSFGLPSSNSGFFYGSSSPPSDWAQNTTTSSTSAHYTDPDGVVRSADGFRRDDTSGNGCLLFHADQVTGSTTARRPVILNRPFRSVGELGYAYRDEPFKSLDFWSSTSADAALLDLFTVADEPVLVAGQINLNNAPLPVLQAIIVGAMKNESTVETCSATDAKNISQQLSTNLAANRVVNRADLTGAVSTTINAILSGASPISGLRNKAYGEAALRALSSVANTRTWNLMIDVIAQTGGMSATAATLSDFNVQGETHYWLHVAIDRFTGQVVDQSLEQVPSGPILNTNSVVEEQAAGATVATINTSGSAPGDVLVYSLVSGTGSTDNASFTLSGNTLMTVAPFEYLTQSTYNIRLNVTDQTSGVSLEQPFIITVQPTPYTRWKITNFNIDANNPAVAGDLVNLSGDGVPNLLKYAMGLNPLAPTGNGVAAILSGSVLTLNYTRGSGATDTTAHAYWSKDLNAWSTSSVSETLLSDDGTTQLWQATVPVDSQTPRLFMRLQVTRP